MPSASVTAPFKLSGKAVTVMVNASPSASLGAVRPSALFCESSVTPTAALSTTGASLAGLTVTVTVAVAVPPAPSEIV